MPDRALSTRQNTGNMSSANETRILRDRQKAYEDAADRARSGVPAYGSPRMLVRVYDGGSMPTTTPRVYFTHPVLVTGAESEGGVGTLTVDTTTTVPVVVLGTKAPSVGDYLTAYSCSNRWIAERGLGSGSGSTSCSPCNIPNEDLTISWTNIITGDGSAPLIYTPGPPRWISACADEGLIFQLQCVDGFELRAIFFIEGECPTGTPSYCSNLRASPLFLTLQSYTCSPFSATFTVSGTDCPTLFGDGNTVFFVSV
jgi:hypothetical protein